MTQSDRFKPADTYTEIEVLGAKPTRRLRILTHVLYGIYALFWLTGGVSMIVAIIINYVKRDDVSGTLYASHFSWQIRTFWWALIFGLPGLLLLPVFFVGMALLIPLSIWITYRLIKGWLYLNDSKPMPV